MQLFGFKMRKDHVRRMSLAAAAGAALIFAGAVPAAATSLPPGPTSVSLANCGPWMQMICGGVGQAVPILTSGNEDVAFSCTAEGGPIEGETGVGCYLQGADGFQYCGREAWTTGPASTTWGLCLVPTQGYVVCVGGGWFSGGNLNPVQNYECGALI